MFLDLAARLRRCALTYLFILRCILCFTSQIHYSEYGIGGGTSGTGLVPALTAEEACRTPYFGVAGPYK